MPHTPHELLLAGLSRDGSRPFLTFYDDATGERVELSVATFANWVAKTANLLRDELGAQHGDRVALLVPAHWQAAVWVGACWALGAVPAATPAGAGVAVAGPDHLDDALGSDAGEIVVVSLRPLGGRFAGPLPPHVHDYALVVPGHGDAFAAARRPAGDDPGWDEDGNVTTLGALVEATEARRGATGAAPGDRLLSTRSPATRGGAVDTLLLPLLIGGSTVLVANPDPATTERHGRRLTTERITRVLD